MIAKGKGSRGESIQKEVKGMKNGDTSDINK